MHVSRPWNSCSNCDTTSNRWCARAGVTSLPGCCQSEVISVKRSPCVCVCVRVFSSPHWVRVAEWAGVFALTAFTRSHCNAESRTRQGKRFYWCCGDLCRWSGLAHCASSRQDDSLDPTAAGTSHLNCFHITLSVCFIVLMPRRFGKFRYWVSLRLACNVWLIKPFRNELNWI